MALVLLLVAGLLEIVWALMKKLSQGFTRPGASAPVPTVYADIK
jgi:multidrug transporter EmrE-like cation transporter